MGRHVPARPRRRHRSPARFNTSLVAVVVATLVAAAAAVWVVTRPSEEQSAEADPGSVCRVDQTVQVTVAPELGPVVRAALSGPVEVVGGGCAVAEVTAEEPLQTLVGLAGGTGERRPQIWVPDDVSWGERAGSAISELEGPLASTSLVLATSRAVAEATGWDQLPPTWPQALTAPTGIVLPDPSIDVEGLLTLAAVRAAAQDEAAADAAVVQAVVQADRTAGSARALQAAVAGDQDAPVVVATEQQVAVATTDRTGDLVRILPAGGSPQLTPSVLRTTLGNGAAVDAVVARLTAAAAAGAEARAAGWWDTAGRSDSGAEQPPPLAVSTADLTALADRVAALVTPSRLLTVVDISASMDAQAGTSTRAELARDALTAALGALPDRTTGSLWVFAARLEGDQDWRELLPPRPFGAPVDGQTQRQALAERFAELPDLLTAGGTGLYDTTLAAVRAARDGFDPAAVNSVVLITDGTDDDSGGTTQQQLLETLRAEADAARPVQVIAVGIGPDADNTTLAEIAQATGGQAFTALDADDLRTVLFQALRSR